MDPQPSGSKSGPRFNPHDYGQTSHPNDRRGQHIMPSAQSSARGVNHIHNQNGHMDRIDMPGMPQPTPLFERLVTEEVNELKVYGRIIENQGRRLKESEHKQGDLEKRLEMEWVARAQLETELEEKEREWALKFKEKEKEIENLKDEVKDEQMKNKKLIDMVKRTDQDIHRMLQRKYDNNREPPHPSRSRRESPHSIRNVRPLNATDKRPVDYTAVSRTEQQPQQQEQFMSPNDYIRKVGSTEAVRVENVKKLLLDLFCL